MTKDTLLEALKSDSVKFSLNEIESIMDEELNKPIEEMDTELIDLCADVLEKGHLNNSENKVYKRISFGKIVLVAAIIIVISSIAIPVTAMYVNNEASEKIVQFYNNHFHIDLSNYLKYDTPKQKGKEFVLPKPISKICDFSNQEVTENSDFKTTIMKFENKDVTGVVTINEYKMANYTEFMGKSHISEDFTIAKQIETTKGTILVFSDEKDSYIYYCLGNKEYDILIENCDCDTAIKYAKSIK